jgi:hypothetical protein
LFWFGQAGVNEVQAGTDFFTFEGSPASAYIDNEDETPVFTRGKDDVLVQSSDTVDADTGNIFTDLFKTVNNWFNGLEAKLGFISSIFEQPYGMLKNAGIPAPISASIALIWYGVGALLFVGFLRGTNQ